MRFEGQQFYLKSRAEMERLFAEVPEAVLNTEAVAEMCDLTIPFPKGSERYPEVPAAGGCRDGPDRLPAAPVHRGPEDSATASTLTRPARRADAAQARILVDRLDYELGVIDSDGLRRLLPRRLGLHRLGEVAGASRSGPGRGSGAGCLVAYLLGITNLDPLRFKLLFERFLNPERVSPPDFDIDFCMRRRGEVIDYVQAEVRRRLRRQHHHLRDAGGEDGDPRRLARPQPALRRGRPAGQDDPGRA